jgi:sulfur carrier protein
VLCQWFRQLTGKITAMSTITINGQARALPAEQTVAELIAALGYAGKRIAIERNGEIVPKSQHASTSLRAGDRLEIVVAVGGG